MSIEHTTSSRDDNTESSTHPTQWIDGMRPEVKNRKQATLHKHALGRPLAMNGSWRAPTTTRRSLPHPTNEPQCGDHHKHREDGHTDKEEVRTANNREATLGTEENTLRWETTGEHEGWEEVLTLGSGI